MIELLILMLLTLSFIGMGTWLLIWLTEYRQWHVTYLHEECNKTTPWKYLYADICPHCGEINPVYKKIYVRYTIFGERITKEFQ